MESMDINGVLYSGNADFLVLPGLSYYKTLLVSSVQKSNGTTFVCFQRDSRE